MSRLENPKKAPEEIRLDEFLKLAKKGKMPMEDIVIRLFDLVIPLYNRVQQLDDLLSHLSQLTEVSQKISDIHALHFSGSNLPKKYSRRDRFMAQILTGPVRKM